MQVTDYVKQISPGLATWNIYQSSRKARLKCNWSQNLKFVDADKMGSCMYLFVLYLDSILLFIQKILSILYVFKKLKGNSIYSSICLPLRVSVVEYYQLLILQ